MKKLLVIFSMVAIFGATHAMDPYRQEALSNLGNSINNSAWGFIIERVAIGILFSSDICKYETPEIRENLRTGKEIVKIRRNQTFFQSLLLELANYHYEDRNYPSSVRVRAFLQGLIIRGYIDSNPELLNDTNPDGSTLFGDSTWYGVRTRNNARLEHSKMLESIKENGARVQQAISSNNMSTLADDIITYGVDEQYLTQLSTTQKQELSKFLDEKFKKMSTSERDSRLCIMKDNLIGQTPEKPSLTKTSFTLSNGKFMIGAALLVVAGLLAYKYYSSENEDEDDTETEEDVEYQKNKAL